MSIEIVRSFPLTRRPLAADLSPVGRGEERKSREKENS
jgi:hypothetical protein